jgi:uncharacterized damage-inducible protein DinB
MTESTTRALNPWQTYVAGLYAVLGSRDPLEVLAQTPSALRAALSGLTGAQESQPEAAGKWSIRQVVAHLADSELVGAFRFRMVLAHDAPSIPGYDQDLWAQRLRYQESDVPTALAEFTAFRQADLRVLRRATPADLQRVMRHSERGDEPLGQMIRMYAGHDLVHLKQIGRIRRAIGAGSTHQ